MLLIYKLQMRYLLINKVFKKFERFNNKIGTFDNENLKLLYEANFCENINKKYIFQLEKMLITKKVQIFGMKLFLNLYVVQDLLVETIGKYKKKQIKTIPDYLEKKLLS